ncbi:beta-galactosidase [Bacillus timonensis]|nr:beta-galactosidase [Bacillus timonensis]
MLHGADYNPEQWLQYPGVFEEDIRLMKLANCNVMSVGIFSWMALEPNEGKFNFDWLDFVLDTFEKNGIYVFLATPSGARPAWMSEKYPEVLRVGPNRRRNLHGLRHNHCFTSPVYREKVKIMNTKLAERYSQHRAVIGWHISNEYGGECHCNYCQDAFRTWLKDKYQTIDNLNHAWWTTFWSHTFTSWSQIESPASHGETMVHGLNLDWKRFVTDQTIDFYRHEIAPLKEKNPILPTTTNFMEAFEGLNYAKFAKEVDFVSWDSYPKWHFTWDDVDVAVWTALNHDMFRSLKNGQPFMLMESTPSLTNWQEISKLKRPGMHLLSSIQAVAHGSNSVQYFQWRKSRGGSEKFHGAVIDHVANENTRVFKDVMEVGEALGMLDEIVDTSIEPEVAIIFDTENRWALKDAQGPRNIGMGYEDTVKRHYKAFWERGIPVDVIDMESDLQKYKLVVAPMLYMVKGGVGNKIEEFVTNGGNFVATYWSGVVDENDLCFLGGFPGPLRKTLGIWSEEIEGLQDGDTNTIVFSKNNNFGLVGSYVAYELCELIHLEGAQALAFYRDDFYEGRPAITVNNLGKGKSYYIASRNKDQFHSDFYGQLTKQLGVKRTINSELPYGVTAQLRTDGEKDFVFLFNFSTNVYSVELTDGVYIDVRTGEDAPSTIELSPYEVKILKRTAIL